MHTFSRSLHSTCSSPTPQLHDWQTATIFTLHATNPFLLFVWAVSENEWNNSICSAQSSCWVKDKQPSLCQTIDHKKKRCVFTAAHKDTSWFEFSQLEDTEWDRCQWLSARWNLSPNNVWPQCYRQTLPRWFRGQGERTSWAYSAFI